MNAAPFAPRDIACPRGFYESAKRLGRSWAPFCETVTDCFMREVDGTQRWFISTLGQRNEFPADEWVKVIFEREAERPEKRGLWYSCKSVDEAVS